MRQGQTARGNGGNRQGKNIYYLRGEGDCCGEGLSKALDHTKLGSYYKLRKKGKVFCL